MESKGTGDKELRNFGILVGGVLAGIFGIVLPIFRHGSLEPMFYLPGACLMATAAVWPRGLAPFYRLWMRLGSLLGWVNTRIILGFFFFFILVPVGLFMRISGYDPLNRKFDPEAESYRIASRIPVKNHFERPF